MLFIDRLAKVTDNAVVQGAVLVNVIGIRGNEDCRNRISRTNEGSVELNPRHPRYVDVGDQAGRFIKTRGCEEFGRRWKGLDGIGQRRHDPFNGPAKESIIFKDKTQLLFHAPTMPLPRVRPHSGLERTATGVVMHVDTGQTPPQPSRTDQGARAGAKYSSSSLSACARVTIGAPQFTDAIASSAAMKVRAILAAYWVAVIGVAPFDAFRD